MDRNCVAEVLMRPILLKFIEANLERLEQFIMDCQLQQEGKTARETAQIIHRRLRSADDGNVAYERRK